MEADLAYSVRLLLEDQREAMVDFVKTLASMESPSSVPQAQTGVLNHIGGLLDTLGYHVVRVPGGQTGGYLYARPRLRERSKPLQLLIGHCDTVWPLNTLQTMPLISDSKTLKGPGVYDMKGGLTQMIFALKLIQELDHEPEVTPIVLINSDEETGSKESTAVIKRLAVLADRAFVLEPSLGLTGKLKTQRKGVGRFTLKVKGRSAHAGLDPTSGASAIVELSYLIQELFKMNDPQKNVSVNVGMVQGGIGPNVVAPESTAVIDVRVPTKEEGERISQLIHNLKPTQPNTTVEVEGSIGRQPMEATPRNRSLWKKARQVGSSLGLDLQESFAGGASDGNTTSLYTATLDGLGATGDGAHAPHEFIYIDKMVERTALLTLLLLMEPVQKPSP